MDWRGFGIAALWGVAVVAMLELLVVVWLRRLPHARWLRLLGHPWALSVGAAAAVAVAPVASAHAWRFVPAVAALLTAILFFALLDRLVFQRPWAPERGPMMPKLVRDVLRALFLAATVLFIATSILEQSLPAVLVSSTVLSAVVGLALQDVLRNVFAGMALELEKPIARGDWLLLDGRPVQVIDSSWRSMRLRNSEGVDFWEPNASFSTARVTSYGSGARPVALVFPIGLPYDLPPARAKAILAEAAQGIPGTLATPAPEAFLEAYGDSAIQYRLRVWTRTVGEQTRLRDAVNTRIWYALAREGVSIPFPIRTLHVHAAEREERRREHASRERARQLLGGLELFAALPAAALERLAAAARQSHYDRSEQLVREGERGDSLFVVDQGRVAVSTAAGDGGSAIQLATLGPGELFGEMSLLTGAPRSASVTADGPCEVLVIAKDDLAPLLVEDPTLAEQLSISVAARQARTAATLESWRESPLATREHRAEASLLARIRSFFKLGTEAVSMPRGDAG